MAQDSSKGMDSGFIELAQEQLDAVNVRLAQIDRESADLQDERATLIGQRANLQGLVNPTEASSSRAYLGKTDVQATQDAVVDLIRAHGRPMHFRDDIYPGLRKAGHEIAGKDPANTLLSRIFNDERLIRTERGTYGLAEWSGEAPADVLGETSTALGRSKVVNAAVLILREAGQPLHYREITERILKAGLWESWSHTPEASAGTAIYRDAKRGRRSRLIKLGDGMIGLRGRDEADA